MNILGFMLNNLPPIYKNENTLKRYRALENQFKRLYNEIDSIQTKYIIETAELEQLLVLGENVGVHKEPYMDIETYRALVKIKYFNTFLIPTHDNIMRVTQKVTGLFPYMKPLWTFGSEEINDQGLYIAYDLDLNYNTEILIKLEDLIGAGIKIRRDYLYKMQGVTLYPATYFFDNDMMNIECEVLPPNQDLGINQELYLSQNYMQIGGL